MTLARPVPLVVRVEDLDTRETKQYAFIKSPVRVGRSEINDLHLPQPWVSTWHGLVQFEGDGITFVDLGSTNGTTLDGVRLDKNAPVEIHAGSDLRIGSLKLTLARREAGDAAPAPRRATAFAMRAVAAPPAAPASSAGVKVVRPVPGKGPVGRISGEFAVPGEAPAPPPAGARPAAPPPSVPGRDPAREALDDAAWQLQVLHDGYAEAKRTFAEAAEAVVQRVPETERARCRALLAERFEAAGAPAAPAPLGSPPAPAPAAAGEEGDEALSLLRAFAESYLPAGAVLEGAAQVRALLEAVADVLETSARSYVELRRGYEEFGKEMGIRVAQGDGPVARARDTRQLLAWLLARSDEPRAPELASAFADLMIHQVALLNGVTEGAKSLLARLSPETIAEALEQESGAGRLALGVKALREGALWRAYLDRYRELTEEDAALSDALFGRDFARAYSAVAGRRAASGEPPEPDADATPRPGGGRRDR